MAAASQPGRPAYVSAGSGLVRVARRFYVVADDELHLGVFPVAGDAPGTLLRLFDGQLPLPTKERKQLKPDFEALALLPPFLHYPHGAMLVLGSGSKSQRRLGALLALTEHGVDSSSVRVLDAAKLFDVMAREVEDLNVEGAVVIDGRLVLMHRGNARHPSNALVSFDLHALLESIADDDNIGKAHLVAVRHYDLGKVDAVPLTFTDGAALPDGSLIFSAVAEQTDDSYQDGPCRGAAVGMIDVDGTLRRIDYLEELYKIEGIHAELEGSGHRLWLVSDADDVLVPAALLQGELR